MKRGDLVVLTWLDAVGPVDLDEGDTLEPITVETVGWVWETAPGHVTLAPERFDDGRVRSATTVPLGMILHVEAVARA
ncbi:MAG: hypothetical protein AMXMBFR53_36480 [Gemmatimonadota bacterium]